MATCGLSSTVPAQCSTVQCSTVHYSTVKYSTIKYITVQCIEVRNLDRDDLQVPACQNIIIVISLVEVKKPTKKDEILKYISNIFNINHFLHINSRSHLLERAKFFWCIYDVCGAN